MVPKKERISPYSQAKSPSVCADISVSLNTATVEVCGWQAGRYWTPTASGELLDRFNVLQMNDGIDLPVLTSLQLGDIPEFLSVAGPQPHIHSAGSVSCLVRPLLYGHICTEVSILLLLFCYILYLYLTTH